MKVMKFGGTSLANWQRFEMAAEIVLTSAREEQVATVLSAPATVTNNLLAMVDMVLAKGMSTRLLPRWLRYLKLCMPMHLYLLQRKPDNS